MVDEAVINGSRNTSGARVHGKTRSTVTPRVNQVSVPA